MGKVTQTRVRDHGRDSEEATAVVQMREKQDGHTAVMVEKGAVQLDSCIRGRIGRTRWSVGWGI